MGLQQSTVDDRPGHGGDVDDRASAVLEHCPALRLARQEHSGDIDVDHSLAQRHLFGRRGVGDSCTVDRQCQRPGFALRVPHRIGEDVGIHDIARYGDGADP